MKSLTFTAISLLTVSVTAGTIATPDAVDDATAFCRLDGQTCDKLKRAANAAADILASATNEPSNATDIDVATTCNEYGQSCHTAKYAAGNLAAAISDAYAATVSPSELALWCSIRGLPCGEYREHEPEHFESKRDADPGRWQCSRGWDCGFKRDAPLEPVKRDPGRWWCYRGWNCGFKRDEVPEPVKRKAEPEAEAEAEAEPGRWQCSRGWDCGFKRDAAADAFCGTDGQPCHKVKRAAEAIAEALAAPEPEPGRFYCYRGWDCGFKRDANPAAFCKSGGQACDVAKRAADQLVKAAADAVAAL